MREVIYPFTEENMAHAVEAWGANCGPSALAFACQVHIDAVRDVIPGFAEKGYTSPTMMKTALCNLGRQYIDMQNPKKCLLFAEKVALVRIQFTGPWTQPGANPKWAYWHTHWIATWQAIREPGYGGAMRIDNLLFDCNGGVQRFTEWEKNIIPLLTGSIRRADGGWFPTHIWRLVEGV